MPPTALQTELRSKLIFGLLCLIFVIETEIYEVSVCCLFLELANYSQKEETEIAVEYGRRCELSKHVALFARNTIDCGIYISGTRLTK
jgi:hypothetical protein